VSDIINEAELGRSKKSNSPSDHLQHLLGLGWAPGSPLIRKYVIKYRLQVQVSEWEASHSQSAIPSKASAKLKNSKV
jgi:hypothetical protein